MQIDEGTAQWLATSIGFLMVGSISYIWKRELGQVKHATVTGDKILDDKIAEAVKTLEQHDARLDANLQQINGIKQEYVSKSDLKEQLGVHLNPIKDGMREMKDDIREMGGDLKELLKRP